MASELAIDMRFFDYRSSFIVRKILYRQFSEDRGFYIQKHPNMSKNSTVSCNYKKIFYTIIKDYLIFPLIAIILGIATIFAVLFIFPVWLLKETNPQKG
ncbi:MAG: hypothetical protein ACM34O_02565 [Ignavibacteria bacterium]